MRYMLGALSGFSEAERVAPADMPELERWVLHRLAELDAEVREGYAKYDFQGVFQKLFAFCTTDLSSVYFDIRKDALYCDAPDSLRRKACRTVLDILFHRLTTWLAPVLVFTMEEVWLERFPGEESSVHLVDFPETPASWRDEALAAKWNVVFLARKSATSQIEPLRVAKQVGSSLEAAVSLNCFNRRELEFLQDVDFAEVCITSTASVKMYERPVSDEAKDSPWPWTVDVALAPGQKCERCWRVLPDVGTHKHSGTCKRCNDALG
jgi:isoleucyl-tRNA synthetase